MVKKIKDMLNKTKELSVVFAPFKRRIVTLFFLVQITSVLESIGLAFFFPLFKALATPNTQEQGTVLAMLQSIFPGQNLLIIICLIISIVTIMKALFVLYRTWYSHQLILDFRAYWMNIIISKYLRASFSYIFSVKQGVLLNNLLGEPRKASKVMELIITFLSKFFVLLYLYIVLLLISTKITVVLSVCFIVIFFLTMKFIAKYSLKIGHKRIEFNQRMIATAAEGMASIRQIKTFSTENRVEKQFRNIIQELFKLNVEFRWRRSLPNVIMETSIVLITMGVIFWLTHIKNIALVSILPVLGIFMVVGYKFFINISFLLSRGMEILAGIPSIRLIYDTATAAVKQDIISHGKKVDQLTHDIHINNVSFQYTDRKVLFDDFTMHIPLRKVTAIIGPSGAGKSTIADLLLSLYMPQKGAIVINNSDLRDVDTLIWRKKVGFVTQDTFIFHSSVKENILIGKLDANDDEVKNAARQANAHDFIMELPQGYDTVVGERGMKLSGGQRQRIAIARAIIRDPELYIFDEATSSLDTESERLIQQSIASLGKKKTVIIITHRVSTITGADIVYKLDQGRIVAKGTLGEVLGSNTSQS